MTRLSTKALAGIEKRLEDIDEGSMRHKILQSAKNFKVSWIELGQSLYTVYRDKLYREWGYTTFEAYTAKEIGVKKTTALKLLKSYYFLEKEEPAYLQKEQVSAASTEPSDVASVPNYESVNLLRLAKNKKALDEDEYRDLKKQIFESGKDAGEVRKSLTSMMRQREELEPEEARRKKKTAVLKRLVSTLRTLKTDIEHSKMLPMSLLKETVSLIAKIEAQIE
jgi:hypothetical protein